MVDTRHSQTSSPAIGRGRKPQTREKRRRAGGRAVLCAALALGAACDRGSTPPQAQATAPGEPRSARTATLEAGAELLQTTAPIGKIGMHLVGFHPAKDDPGMQMESHHFCNQVNEEFAQCVLYDGDTPDARLHGIEFIISERMYATLPAEEKPYWHPHNYEILSGTLRMPNLPDAAETAALRDKMNSYGKTWHVWKTGVFGQQPDALPLGPAHLAWSFNHDGEALTGLVEARDRRMRLDSNAARHQRSGLSSVARPQGGVNAMREQFPRASEPMPGVRDNGDTRTRQVPRVSLEEPRPGSGSHGLPR
jgi:hypothetical protein